MGSKIKKAFTLVELLVVLAIIGALMAIGVPVYSGALENAYATVVAANMRIIADNLRINYLAEGTITTDPGEYVTLKDIDDYKIYASEVATGIDAVIEYSGKKAPADKIAKRLASCSRITQGSTGTQRYVRCHIELTGIF